MLSGFDPKIEPWLYILADANATVQPLVLAKANEFQQALCLWLRLAAETRQDADAKSLTAEMTATVQYWRWLGAVLIERPAAVWPIEVSKSGKLWLIVGEA